MESGLVERAGIAFKSIPASGIHGVGLKALPGNISRLVRGVFASMRILREYQPDALLLTGGYVAVPMAVAAWRVPTLLYVPDIEPGLALKTLSRFADRIAITSEDSAAYFRKDRQLSLTGYPVRPELTGWERPAARKTLHLSEDVPVLMISGGSKGARTINNPVWQNLASLLELTQVVHITGELDWPMVEKNIQTLPPELAERYHPFPYLHEQMGAVLSAADLALSRSGASTLGEYPLYGLPAILVPYPFAWRYQKTNAEHLVRQGAAVMLENEQLSSQLVPVVASLIHDPDKLTSMRRAMQRLSHPQAAKDIGRLLYDMAEKRSGDRG